MRPTNLIGLGCSLFALLFAYQFLEKSLNLEPCPLCILDRIVVGLMAVVFAAGLFVDKMGPRLGMLGFNVFLVCIGFVLTGRHVWLQNQPFNPESVCLAEQPEIQGMMELVKEAFDAQADCGLISWEVFGMSIPMLTLLMFVGFLFLLFAQAFGMYQEKYAPPAEEDED